ncbi:MAG TPA: GAF domain-containing sensor histidine kinase [Polyangiaceae bacterium]
MTDGQGTSSLFDATRLGLSRMALSHADELTRALQQAARAGGQALATARTGIWFLSSDASELRCMALFELSQDRCSVGGVLPLSQLPGLLPMLEQRRVLTWPNSEVGVAPALQSSYFDALDISSGLDAPIFRLGEVVGVVRHEHVGSPREWSSRDRHLAGSVADLIAVLLEQATRLDVEAALSTQRERLIKAEKMEALSRMSAGVAHDFNNVLTAMLIKIEAVLLDRESDPELERELREVLDVGQRGARLVHQLLTFAKAKLPAPRPVDLTRTLRELEPMLTTLAQGKAQLRIVHPNEPFLVNVDPSQLEQVMMNLVLNARDAAAPDRSQVEVRLESDPESVVLRVTDHGAGMDAATREQVFEPFFSTKEQGSGLGLATVYSIVQQAGGSISVESAQGQGSTFSVRLPLIQ